MQFAAPGLSQKSHNHFPKAWWVLSLEVPLGDLWVFYLSEWAQVSFLKQ
jgi:hypothetical protein